MTMRAKLVQQRRGPNRDRVSGLPHPANDQELLPGLTQQVYVELLDETVKREFYDALGLRRAP